MRYETIPKGQYFQAPDLRESGQRPTRLTLDFSDPLVARAEEEAYRLKRSKGRTAEELKEEIRRLMNERLVLRIPTEKEIVAAARESRREHARRRRHRLF
jgi:hypothetical protein